MDPLLDGLREAGQAVIRLLAMPYSYIALFLVWWHAKQGVGLQRRLFHVRLYGSVTVALSRLAGGAAVGLGLSLAGLGAGTGLTAEAVLIVWAATVFLAIFRLRYVCLAYSAGAVGIAQAIAAAVVPDGYSGIFARTFQVLEGVDAAGLIFMAGLLHIAEGLLVRLQPGKLAVPLFLEGKRGKPYGAYSLSGLWPIPLLWLVPASSAAEGFTLPWSPLFGDGAASWTLLAFPVLLGFSDRTETFWPERKAALSGNSLMVYGAVVALLAAGAAYWSPLAVVSAVAAFALHEGLVYVSRWQEKGRPPLYVQDGHGVKILAVLPGTPAAEMGLVAGETIKKLNGVAVRTKEELHRAMQLQAAFSKLEVVNREGHIKFVQRARYAGEHHQLGLILAPDEDVDFVATPRSASLWQGLRAAGAQRRNGAGTAWLRAKAELAAAEAEQAAAAEAAKRAAEEQEAKAAADAKEQAAKTAAEAEAASKASLPTEPGVIESLPSRKSRK